jgi:hypothetical protein
MSALLVMVQLFTMVSSDMDYPSDTILPPSALSTAHSPSCHIFCHMTPHCHQLAHWVSQYLTSKLLVGLFLHCTFLVPILVVFLRFCTWGLPFNELLCHSLSMSQLHLIHFLLVQKTPTIYPFSTGPYPTCSPWQYQGLEGFWTAGEVLTLGSQKDNNTHCLLGWNDSSDDDLRNSII